MGSEALIPNIPPPNVPPPDAQPEGPLAPPTAAPPDNISHGPLASNNTMDLPGTLRSIFQSGIGASDAFLGRARQGMSEFQGAGPGGPLEGNILADILNPIPGNTAQLLSMAATVPIKGSLITGPLKRSLAAGVTGGAIEGLKGENPITEGLKYGGGQLLGEIPAGVAGGILNQIKLSRAKAGIESKSSFNKAMQETLTKADKAQFKQDLAKAKSVEDATNVFIKNRDRILTAEDMAMYQKKVAELKSGHAAATAAQKATFAQEQRRHAEQAAARIAEHYKQQVPSWSDLPGNETGLVEMVYGKGQQRLSVRFESAMRAAKEKAQGVGIQMNPLDAQALGIRVPKEVMDLGPITVDAAHVIDLMAGKSQSARGAYRRAASALDAANIGDPTVRAEYKAGQSLIEFAENNEILKGGKLNPDAILKGLTTKVRKVNVLRHRGQGNALEGPFYEATLGRPQPPSPLTPPSMPDKPMPRISSRANVPQPQQPRPRIAPPEPQLPEEFQVRTIPDIVRRHPYLSAGIAGGGFASMGMGHPTAGLLSNTGLLAGLALGGRQFATRAPLTPLQELQLRLGYTLGGSGVRGAIEESGP